MLFAMALTCSLTYLSSKKYYNMWRHFHFPKRSNLNFSFIQSVWDLFSRNDCKIGRAKSGRLKQVNLPSFVNFRRYVFARPIWFSSITNGESDLGFPWITSSMLGYSCMHLWSCIFYRNAKELPERMTHWN